MFQESDEKLFKSISLFFGKMIEFSELEFTLHFIQIGGWNLIYKMIMTCNDV